MGNLIVRDEVLQQVRPHGTFEIQAHFVGNNPALFNTLQAVSRGFVTRIRVQGDLNEVYSLHDSRSAAEGTLREWKRLQATV